MYELINPDELALQFASEFNVDLTEGIASTESLQPRLVQLNPDGSPLHLCDQEGADYYLQRVDYSATNNLEAADVVASRLVAVIMPGYHTKTAFWPEDGDSKNITVHRGVGYLVVNRPNQDDTDDPWNTETFHLDPDITHEVKLPPGCFYVVEAASWSPTPLVISVVSAKDDNGNWGAREVTVEHGKTTIRSLGRLVTVPDDFISGDFS